MSDYNEQIHVAKKIMEQDKEALFNLSKDHDLTKIYQLRKEHPNLDNYILSLTDIIAKLEVNNIDLTNKLISLEKEKADLVKRHIELENSLIELRKYHKEFEQFAATVYDPKKSTYKELEVKVALAENSKQTAIDDLYETKVGPLQNQVKEKDNLLDIANHKNQCKDSRIKQLEEIIKDQQTIINYAAGYISACEQFRDKHPNDVVKWLFKGLK